MPKTTESNTNYWDQSTIYLSTFSQSNVWGSHDRDLPKRPSSSKDFRWFPKTSEHSGKCPKIFRRLLSTSEAIQKTTILACFHFTRTQSHLYAPFWNIFVETELNFRYSVCVKEQFFQIRESGREIVRDALVRKAWDSRIIRESWQAYNQLKKRDDIVITKPAKGSGVVSHPLLETEKHLDSVVRKILP